MGLLTIAYKNLKKNFSFYSLYFVSVAFVLTVFFSFISFSMNDIIMEKISSDGRVETMSKTVAVFVMAFVLFYMSYSNTFFMKRRMKELGIYSLLGYRKSSMLRLLTIENILICLGSLLAGVVMGAILHKGIVEVIVKALKLQIETSAIPLFNYDAILFTLTFVLAVLVVLFFFQLVCPSKKLCINFGSHGEKRGKENKSQVESLRYRIVIHYNWLCTSF